MKFAAVFLLLSPGFISSQPVISPPEIGFVQDDANALRRVSGVAGSFRLGESIRTSVVSSAFSGTLGMAKTDSSIYVFDRAGLIIFKAPVKAGAALFAFSDDGGSGVAYLVREGKLLRWSGRSLVRVALDADAIGGDVLTIAQPSAAFGSMLVERAGRLWQLNLSLASGAIDTQHVLPGITAPVLLLNDGGLVSVDANGITLRPVNGTEMRFDA